MSQHYTSVTGERKKVTVDSNQKKYWVEFQLLDELGVPVTNMPYRAVNDATRSKHIKEYTGHSDASGIIRIEDLHYLDLTLLISAQPLADEMEKRTLRLKRDSQGSTVKPAALLEGYEYQYVRIGQLCDKYPNLIPEWKEKKLPEYHFPDGGFSGFTIKKLGCRYVLEICPFRAWSLILHHTPKYSVVNAFNLILMSVLSYSDGNFTELGSITGSINNFFNHQMLDLSRIPYRLNDKEFHPIVKDVPFNQRYTDVYFIDSSQGGNAKGDTQLFFAANKTELIVAWRGTASLQDVRTDATYKPIDLSCDIKTPCSGIVNNGLVHQGFLDGFNVIDKSNDHDIKDSLRQLIRLARDRELYICGHSLGGALALIQAAKFIGCDPILYTYGMPRTFTMSAMVELEGLVHYRHINENDAVPSVPPERELDNNFYKIWGPLGYIFGYGWSVVKLLVPIGSEVFCHHGEVVHFFRAESVQEWIDEPNPRVSRKIRKRLPKSAKLYLVPCLSIENNKMAKDSQQEFIQKLDSDSKNEFFPKHGNPALKDALSGSAHPSGKYADYIGGRLMELYDLTRLDAAKKEQGAFISQMEKYRGDIPIAEYNRNNFFLAVDRLLSTTLDITKSLQEGDMAMQRYCLKEDS